MAKTVCEAKKTGQVPFKGKRTLEWRSKDGTPHCYCYGWKDASTEELLGVCSECKTHVNFAQEDMDKEILNEFERP